MGKKNKSNKKQGPKKEKKKQDATQSSALVTTDTEYSDDDWTQQSQDQTPILPKASAQSSLIPKEQINQEDQQMISSSLPNSIS
jgi:hypothetical protein